MKSSWKFGGWILETVKFREVKELSRDAIPKRVYHPPMAAMPSGGEGLIAVIWRSVVIPRDHQALMGGWQPYKLDSWQSGEAPQKRGFPCPWQGTVNPTTTLYQNSRGSHSLQKIGDPYCTIVQEQPLWIVFLLVKLCYSSFIFSNALTNARVVTTTGFG